MFLLLLFSLFWCDGFVTPSDRWLQSDYVLVRMGVLVFWGIFLSYVMLRDDNDDDDDVRGGDGFR